MNKTRLIVLFAALVSVAVLTVGIWFYRYATTPSPKASNDEITLWIKPGQSFFETIDQLQSAGLVRHPDRFRWLAYLQGYERQIRAGEYALSSTMPPAVILETLVHGRPLLHKIVLPEGITTARVGELLEEADLIDREYFVQKATDAELASRFGLDAPSVEGYLFPETYFFPKGISAEEAIGKMVEQFHAVFTPQWRERAQGAGLSVHEVVTLASIVEKETAMAEERPLIAAVFLNRLKQGMRLESDPTVIYGIKDFSGNLTRRDLDTQTPYNTYKIRGLPPGPIGNPGQAAIKSVLYPSQVPYLYFVSRNDGSHHFSRTFAEHLEMVRKYQLNRP